MLPTPCPAPGERTDYFERIQAAVDKQDEENRIIAADYAKVCALQHDLALDTAHLAVRRQRQMVVRNKILRVPYGPALDALLREYDELGVEVRESDWLVEKERRFMEMEKKELRERHERAEERQRLIDEQARALRDNRPCLMDWPGARVCCHGDHEHGF